MARVNVEKLPDEELVQAFQRAVGYNHRTAVVKFGKEIIDRPAFADRKERALAYMTLARMEDDLDRALTYVDAGRKATDSTGKSHATWDLEELSLRFARQEIPEALQLIRHIEHTHINEPNVSLILTQILVEAGLLAPRRHPGHTARPPASGNGRIRRCCRRTRQTLDPRQRIRRRRRKTLGAGINDYVIRRKNTRLIIFSPRITAYYGHCFHS